MLKTKRIFVIIMLGVLLLSIPEQTYANRRGNHNKAKIVRVSKLPMGYRTFHLGRAKYFMSAGVFYKRSFTGYRVITAPIGLCINSLPIGFQIIHINNKPYFFYENTYYQYDPAKSVYIVVEEPVEEK